MALEMDYDYVTLLLRHTEDLLSQKNGWTQHAARCGWFHQRYCAVGALVHVAKQQDIDSETIRITMAELNSIAKHHGFDNIVLLNDHPATTQKVVVDVFHEAVVEREKNYGPIV